MKNEFIYLKDVQDQLDLNRTQAKHLMDACGINIFKVYGRLCVPLSLIRWRLDHPTKASELLEDLELPLV